MTELNQDGSVKSLIDGMRENLKIVGGLQTMADVIGEIRSVRPDIPLRQPIIRRWWEVLDNGLKRFEYFLDILESMNLDEAIKRKEHSARVCMNRSLKALSSEKKNKQKTKLKITYK